MEDQIWNAPFWQVEVREYLVLLIRINLTKMGEKGSDKRLKVLLDRCGVFGGRHAQPAGAPYLIGGNCKSVPVDWGMSPCIKQEFMDMTTWYDYNEALRFDYIGQTQPRVAAPSCRLARTCRMRLTVLSNRMSRGFLAQVSVLGYCGCHIKAFRRRSCPKGDLVAMREQVQRVLRREFLIHTVPIVFTLSISQQEQKKQWSKRLNHHKRPWCMQ